jgi:hypothetical protein
VQASSKDPGEEGIFRAVEGASLFDDPDIVTIEEDDGEDESTSTKASEEDTPSPAPKPARKKPGPSPAPKPKPKPGKPSKKSSSLYKVLRKGAEGCPPGHEIDTVEECFKAMEELGLRAQPPWISVYPGLPRHCSIRERPTSDSGMERMHFNSASEGQGRSDLAPVCKIRPQHSQPSQAGAAGADEKIPELSSATKEALLGGEGFSLVYLREGRINEEEKEMLTQLEAQFRPQLESQGTKIAWMWMDLHVQRKFKAHFDPPALPSAVVLNPHKRPRFAIVKHNEDVDGDPLPADQHTIALLLNTILGGDAQFSPLPQKALSKFAE